jgi:glycine/serine hydroxymethyltransferase
MAAYEMNAFKAPFQNQVRANARALAKALHAHGIPVEGDPADGYTETHQVIIRVKPFGPGMEIARRLEDNNVLTNYQALPDDATFLDSSGIRLGVQEMTRFGMVEKDFDELAGLIADVIVRNRPAAAEVAKYRKSFLTMGFTLPPAEALPLAARLLTSVIPDPGYAARFVDNLRRTVGA